MATKPYFNKILDEVQTKAVLRQCKAVKLSARSTTGTTVYKVHGGGEAMVEVVLGTQGDKFRVQLYAGQCPC